MKQTTAYLFLICLVSAMGGLLFGYDWVVIGGAMSRLCSREVRFD